MYIEELKENEGQGKSSSAGEVLCKSGGDIAVSAEAKRVLVGAGARALFYPTLLYNVLRNKIQAEFRWWDWIDEFVLLGAVPFPSDVLRLKELGVSAVVTLNEPYETLVSPSLYKAHGIHHLVLATRDYLFAPSVANICRAVDFVHENASQRQSTYIHCKAGRGRSTTIVICYLVKYRHMKPDAAYDYVKSIRPRVLLASAQWEAVQEFYHLNLKANGSNLSLRRPQLLAKQDRLSFDDCSVVVITESDLDGYLAENEGSTIWADVNLIYRVKVAGEVALTRLSGLWFIWNSRQTISNEKVADDGRCVVDEKQLGSLSVDIHVFS